MNSLSPVNQKPLKALSVDEGRRSIGVLLVAYPEPWAGTPPANAQDAAARQSLNDAKVNAYVLAIQGLPGWAIEQTVTDFLQGRVDRRRRDKLPTAEEVAALAREHVHKEAARQTAQRAHQEQVEESRAWEEHQRWLKTPEGQRRQQEKASRAAEILAKHGLRSIPTE